MPEKFYREDYDKAEQELKDSKGKPIREGRSDGIIWKFDPEQNAARTLKRLNELSREEAEKLNRRHEALLKDYARVEKNLRDFQKNELGMHEDTPATENK